MQSNIDNIRDSIQQKMQAGFAQTGSSTQPLGYVDQVIGSGSWADQALGYAAPGSGISDPLVTKAPRAPAAAESVLGLAVWSQAFGDYEQRQGIVNGFDTGRDTRTGGIIVGVDKTYINGNYALVLGLLGGDTLSHVNLADGSTSRIQGPSAGAYGIWIDGGFSLDSMFKVDFLGIDQTSPGQSIPGFGADNYSAALNLNNKIEFSGWWAEPTVGILDTWTIWNDAGRNLIGLTSGGLTKGGLTNGNDFRVLGGSRFGTTFAWGEVSVQATLTALAYDDVSITGGTVFTATALAGPLVSVPTDEGKIFGEGIGKLNFDLDKIIKGLSFYTESQIRGRPGVLGLAQSIGIRYTW